MPGIECDIIKRDDEQHLVFGFGKLAFAPGAERRLYVDKQGDFITPEDLESSVYEFVLKSRDGGVMHDPGAGVVSTLVESVVFTRDKLEKMGIDPDTSPIPEGAWWLGYHVQDDAVWDRVVKGELTAFSIEGTGTREADE